MVNVLTIIDELITLRVLSSILQVGMKKIEKTTYLDVVLLVSFVPDTIHIGIVLDGL